jgi:hypothetical protein
MVCLELVLTALATLGAPQEPEPTATLLLVVGAEGEAEYGEELATWAARWEPAAARGGAEVVRVGPLDEPPGAEAPPAEQGAEATDLVEAGASAEPSDRERLRASIAELDPSETAPPLWLVFLGHGTFDGAEAKLNLRGPDVAAAELAGWLEPVQRPTAVVVCAAASAPFVNRLSRPGRVIVTATRSGHEYSWSRFGGHLSSALEGLEADLDKDGQVSLLEAFLSAAAGVEEWYAQAGRLASEHALIDDNGDGLGTPADFFRGVRSTQEPEPGTTADGARARQLCLVPSAAERAIPPDVRRLRDALELRLEELRSQKEELGELEYYARLEVVLVRLAQLYAELEGGGEE